jgi:Ca2+-dependent lipid-binding protein
MQKGLYSKNNNDFIFLENIEKIKFVVHSAEVFEKQDLVGAGDPYVKFQFGDEEKRTKTQNDTQHPVWEEGFFFLICFLLSCF